MADPHVFDEMSSRINKTKRPDSGIHNSTEINGEQEIHIKNQEPEPSSRQKKAQHQEDFVDSGQESDQLDSSANVSGSSKKKNGFLNNFKKIFKKKKSSSKSDKSAKKKDGKKKLSDQTKASSEPQILSDEDPRRQFKRNNTEVAMDGDSEPRNDKDESPEKRNSLKDGAQQYIRSSLRKLKGKKSKGDGDEATTPTHTQEEIAFNSNTNINLDDEFFSKKLNAEENGPVIAAAAPVKIADLKSTAPKIQTDAAKDKIRIAPQNRRKPSRYRGMGGGTPRSTSIHSFNNEPSNLSKIDEDQDNFISTNRSNNSFDRNSSSYSHRDSSSTLRDSSYSKHDSTEQNLITEEEDNRRKSDPALRVIKKHSFNANDVNGEPRKIRTIAQRSLSSNSRENINRQKAPAKPPRSTHTSTNSLNRDEIVSSRDFSLTSLNKEIFYSGDSNPEKIESSGGSYGLNSGSNSSLNREKNPLSEINQNVPKKPIRLSKTGSITRENEVKVSQEELVSNSQEIRTSLEDVFKRGREGMNLSRGSQEFYTGSKEDIHRKSKEDIKHRSKEDINHLSKKIDSNTSTQELIFQKTDNHGMMAFALTSPNSDSNENMEPVYIPRSKSFSEKIEQSLSNEDITNGIRQRSRTGSSKHTSKSHGFINEVGNSASFSEMVMDDRPAVGPRKLRRPVSPPERKPETHKTPEFNRVSLKKVPKVEDYMGEANQNVEIPREKSKNETPDNHQFNRISLKNVPKVEDYLGNGNTAEDISPITVSQNKSRSQITSDCNTDTTSPEKNEILVNPQKDLRSSDIFVTKKPTPPKEIEESNTKGSEEHQWKRNSLKKVENANGISALDTDELEKEFNAVLDTIFTSGTNKRESWQNLEERRGKSVEMQNTPQEPEFIKHSLKKVESENQNTFSLPLKKSEIKPEPVTHAASMEQKQQQQTKKPVPDKPEKPIIQSRPTVHVKTSFKFQSNDVLPRSKSVSSAEAARQKKEKETESAEKNPDDGEPEWFKLARKKQKNEGDEQEKTQERKSEVINKPTSPTPITAPKPRPKVSPRPVVSPKPDNSGTTGTPSRPPEVSAKPTVSPRPNNLKSPPTAPKSFNISPSASILPTTTRNSRNFNPISKNTCLVCNKTAYAIEKIDVNGYTLHQNCAKCEECNRKLNIGNIFIKSDKVYCSQHN